MNNTRWDCSGSNLDGNINCRICRTLGLEMIERTIRKESRVKKIGIFCHCV